MFSVFCVSCVVLMEDYLQVLSFLGPDSTTRLSAAALHEAATDICELCCLCLHLRICKHLVFFGLSFYISDHIHLLPKSVTNENYMLNLSDMFDGEELC